MKPALLCGIFLQIVGCADPNIALREQAQREHDENLAIERKAYDDKMAAFHSHLEEIKKEAAAKPQLPPPYRTPEEKIADELGGLRRDLYHQEMNRIDAARGNYPY